MRKNLVKLIPVGAGLVVGTTLLLLAAATASADDNTNVSLYAQFVIQSDTGENTNVSIFYLGTHEAGNAVAIYTSSDGSILRDDMTGCRLSNANTAWKIDCTNPHYTSWDGGGYTYFSPLYTDGRLLTRRIVGSRDIRVRYEPRPRD